MSYYSDVMIVAQKEIAHEFAHVNNKYGFFKVTEIKPNEVIFEAKNVKWYDWNKDFPEIQAFCRIMKANSRYHKGRGYRFLRIGENDDDTEINTNNGGLFEDYYIVRKFNTTRR